MSDNPFNDQLWAQVCQAFDDGWDYGVQEKLNHKGKRAEGLRRAISALRSAGWAVVPVEPTEGMIAACSEAAQGTLSEMSMKYIVGDAEVYITGSFDGAAVWKAMLKTAQEDSRG